MRVRCVATVATPEQVQRYGLQVTIEHRYDVTPGKEYLVLGLTALAADSAYGTGVTIEVLDDFGRWSIQPLFLFEVIDPRPSRHWVAKQVGEAELALWPESFHQDYYHDHLTDGVPEVVADFNRVCSLLEAEFAADEVPTETE